MKADLGQVERDAEAQYLLFLPDTLSWIKIKQSSSLTLHLPALAIDPVAFVFGSSSGLTQGPH